jgi:hypothetical protein
VDGNQKKNDALLAKNLLEGKTCEFCAYKEEEYYEKKDTKHLCLYEIDKRSKSEIKVVPNIAKENTCEHWKKLENKDAIKLIKNLTKLMTPEIIKAWNKDSEALAGDWAAIGEDFKTILGDFTKWSSKE